MSQLQVEQDTKVTNATKACHYDQLMKSTFRVVGSFGHRPFALSPVGTHNGTNNKFYVMNGTQFIQMSCTTTSSSQELNVKFKQYCSTSNSKLSADQEIQFGSPHFCMSFLTTNKRYVIVLFSDKLGYNVYDLKQSNWLLAKNNTKYIVHGRKCIGRGLLINDSIVVVSDSEKDNENIIAVYKFSNNYQNIECMKSVVIHKYYRWCGITMLSMQKDSNMAQYEIIMYGGEDGHMLHCFEDSITIFQLTFDANYQTVTIFVNKYESLQKQMSFKLVNEDDLLSKLKELRLFSYNEKQCAKNEDNNVYNAFRMRCFGYLPNTIQSGSTSDRLILIFGGISNSIFIWNFDQNEMYYIENALPVKFIVDCAIVMHKNTQDKNHRDHVHIVGGYDGKKHSKHFAIDVENLLEYYYEQLGILAHPDPYAANTNNNTDCKDNDEKYNNTKKNKIVENESHTRNTKNGTVAVNAETETKMTKDDMLNICETYASMDGLTDNQCQILDNIGMLENKFIDKLFENFVRWKRNKMIDKEIACKIVKAYQFVYHK